MPVSRTSTVLFDSVADADAAYPPLDGRLSYGRNGTWTQWSLAEALTELEPGAAGTMLFPSGSAAVSIALTSVLAPGDELLMVDSAYGPTRHFCDRELKRLGIATPTMTPSRHPKRLKRCSLRSAVQYSWKARARSVRSPGRAGHLRDGEGSRDHHFARQYVGHPIFLQGMAKGVDLSIVACTKYISGHSDVMMGAVTAAPSHLKQLTRTSRSFGQYVSPDDAYLVARGLRTLGVRLRQHERGAVKVAHWLKNRPQVAQILHPAKCWKAALAMSSGSAILTARLVSSAFLEDRRQGRARRSRRQPAAIRNRLQLGRVQSLAIPADVDKLRTAAKRDYGGPLVRRIGLEDRTT